MKLSVITDEIDHDLDVALPFITELSIHWVALRNVHKHSVVELPAGEVEMISQQIAMAGMQVSCLMSPLFKGELKQSSDERAKQEVMTAAEVARKLGTSLVRVFAFKTQHPSVERDAFDVVSSALNAGAIGTLVPCLENEYGGHIDTIESIAQHWTAVSSACPLLQVALDPVNHMRAGGARDLVSLMTPQLMATVRDIHVKDVNSAGEYVPIGDGIVDWPAVFAHLHHINYTGFVTVEAHLDQHPNGVERSIENVRNWLN